MKSLKTGALSGCVVWIILIGMVGSCIVPVSFFVGGFTSFTDTAIQFTGGILCPENTTPTSYTYSTTSRDEFGNPVPATAQELHCIDSSGEVVLNDPVGYAFLWSGIIVGVGILLSLIISFLIAAPAGALIGRLLGKIKARNIAQ